MQKIITSTIIAMAAASSLYPGTAIAQKDANNSSAAQTIKIGETKHYKDWISGCDNTQSCEAVALMDMNNASEFHSLLIKRKRADDENIAPVSISMQGIESTSDRYRILIDGKVVDTGAIDKDAGEIAVQSQDALKLARAIAKGNVMILQDGANKKIARFSLSGSAASLRYMDAKLGLAGSAYAMVARGRNAAAKKQSETPSISVKLEPRHNNIPDTPDLIKLVESSPCNEDRFGFTEDRAFPLGRADGKDRALVLISCGSGAYNFTSAVYTGTKSGDDAWKFAPAPFDYNYLANYDNGDLPMVVNAYWDPNTQSLSGHNKGRGLGDCGMSDSYVWDGTQFRLTRMQTMTECRGSLDWITIWRAQIKYTR